MWGKRTRNHGASSNRFSRSASQYYYRLNRNMRSFSRLFVLQEIAGEPCLGVQADPQFTHHTRHSASSKEVNSFIFSTNSLSVDSSATILPSFKPSPQFSTVNLPGLDRQLNHRTRSRRPLYPLSIGPHQISPAGRLPNARFTRTSVSKARSAMPRVMSVPPGAVRWTVDIIAI